jgi:MurNAc alpha-1-phosphate uridylyltransferase
MRAMILAAGEGSRLRPLTTHTHKALLPIGDTCLLSENLKKLARANIKDIVINVSYLAEQIMDYVGDGSRFGVRVQYSHEKEGRLGTAGGIHQALDLFDDEPFWVVSADIYSDYSIDLNKTLAKNTDIFLVMVPNPSYHPAGDFGFLSDGPSGSKLLSLDAVPKYTFGNISLLHPRLFLNYRLGVYELGAVFRDAINTRRAHGELYQGSWYNMGTPADYEDLRARAKLNERIY